LRTRLAISLQSEDRARISQIEDAIGLVDGRAVEDPDWHKPFGRLRGNDFTLEDAEAGVANILALADLRLKSEAPFDDPSLAATWAEGRDQAARRASELAQSFLDALREDLVEALQKAG